MDESAKRDLGVGNTDIVYTATSMDYRWELVTSLALIQDLDDGSGPFFEGLETFGDHWNVGVLIAKELESQGVIALARGRRELAEEHPSAYKNVDEVVEVVEKVGMAKRVARLRTLVVIKG